MVIHNVSQNTPEWHKLRAGKITGSGVGSLMAKGRGEMFGGTAKSYINEKVAELLTGLVCEHVDNRATRWGHEKEQEALARFEWESLIRVDEIGFCEVSERMGCSPDGVTKYGIIEIKCPFNQTNHYNTLVSGKVPDKYFAQVQYNMWCMNVKKCHFISYDPRYKENEQIAIIPVDLDKDYVYNMLNRVDAAIELIDKQYKDFRG